MLLILFVFTSTLYSQVKETEIKSKNSKGKAELINFRETKIKSDDTSVNSFLKKQYNTEDEVEFKSDSKSYLKENLLESKKYQQYYKGLKVEFGIQNSVSQKGVLKTTNGRFVDIKNLDISPKLSEKEALQFAISSTGAKEYIWENKENEVFLKKEQKNQNATFYPKGELLIVQKDLFSENPVPTLAYKFDIYASNPLSRDYIYIDANNGEILLKDAIIKHIQGIADTRYSGQKTIETQQVGNQYKLRDYSRGGGIETYNMNHSITPNYNLATDFIDNDNNWTNVEYNNPNKDNAALDAHWGAAKTYDYFLNKHNRNSFDGNNGVIRNYVHYSNNYDNAFWDGQRMNYGDGGVSFTPLTSVDVVAHEIGHGVCSSTANLFYGHESGAINEGLSDIWGAMVEYFADPTKQTYLIGEEIKIGGALRSISNPKSKGESDTYGGTYWINPNCGTPTPANDRCGVHTNSGVLNHWFYILAEGKSETNDIGSIYNIAGIGKDKAAKIVYRAESVYLTPTTNYAQARELTIQASNDLYGTNSVESATVCQSWYAVGIGNSCIVPIVINGENTICSSTTNYTYTIPNLAPGLAVNWNVSSNLIIVSTSTASIVVKPTNSTINGSATITATVSGQNSTKKVWIGKPQIGIQLVSDSNYVDIYLIGINNTDIYSQGITSTTWVKTTSTNGGTAGGSGFEGFGNGPNFNWTATLKITSTNSCGSTEITETVTCAAPIPCGEISYIISPSSENQYTIYEIILPCDGFSEVTKEALTFYNGKIETRIYDFQGNEVLKTNVNNINTSELKPGIYIIKINVDNQIITSKIIKS